MKRALIAALFITRAAFAQYDVIVTGRNEHNDWVPTADMIAAGQTITVVDIELVAPAPEGRVFAIMAGNPSRVVELLHAATALRAIGELPRDWIADALVVDRDANTHILATRKPYGVALFTMDAYGIVRAEHQMSSLFFGTGAPGVIDLAADQCTLFISDRFKTIKRFDVCEGKFLSDFGSSGSSLPAKIRILPDGGLLAAGELGAHRIDANGKSVSSSGLRTEVLPMAVMLARNGTRVVVAGERCYRDSEAACPSDPLEGQLEVIEMNVGAPRGKENEITIGKLTNSELDSITSLFAWTAALGNARSTRRRAAGR